MHDLLRAYATELVHEAAVGAGADRAAALVRMLDYYVHNARAAALLVRPGRPAIDVDPPAPGTVIESFAGRADAQAWFAREHAQLVGAVELAADGGHPGHAWRLAWALEDVLDFGGNWEALLRIQQSALRAASGAGDRVAQANAHSGLGRAYCMRREFDRAHTHLRTALALYEQFGDRPRQATTLRHIGLLHCHQDLHEEALAYAERGLEFLPDCPPIEQAYMFSYLSWFHCVVGNHDQALAYGQRALAIPETAEDPAFRGNVIDGIGYINYELGRLDEAVTWYETALDCYRDAEFNVAKAGTLDRLGHTYSAMGRTATAAECWARGAHILEPFDPAGAASLRQRIEELPRS
jgi:tetratricopeptide (TPR) repeat protein